jgi:hypothetical protein
MRAGRTRSLAGFRVRVKFRRRTGLDRFRQPVLTRIGPRPRARLAAGHWQVSESESWQPVTTGRPGRKLLRLGRPGGTRPCTVLSGSGPVRVRPGSAGGTGRLECAESPGRGRAGGRPEGWLLLRDSAGLPSPSRRSVETARQGVIRVPSRTGPCCESDQMSGPAAAARSAAGSGRRVGCTCMLA